MLVDHGELSLPNFPINLFVNPFEFLTLYVYRDKILLRLKQFEVQFETSRCVKTDQVS